jgi:6-phosphogluconolactonase
MADVKIFRTPAELARAAAEWIVEAARRATNARGRFAIMLAGGNTPRAVHECLASPTLTQQVDWSRVQIFWGDERCVPPEAAESNYRMARETLLERVPVPPQNIHRIRGEDDRDSAACAYEQELRAFGAGRAEQVVPRIDLVLLGMGDDGHTASLFPHSPVIAEKVRWFAGVEHHTPPSPLVDRVTATPVVLNAAREVTFLVSGASKAERLREVLTGPHDPERLPAQAVQPASGRLMWFLDADAARLLDRAAGA